MDAMNCPSKGQRHQTGEARGHAEDCRWPLPPAGLSTNCYAVSLICSVSFQRQSAIPSPKELTAKRPNPLKVTVSGKPYLLLF